MNRTRLTGFLLAFVVCFTVLLFIRVGEGAEDFPAAFTDQQLDDLVGRIALYPDPLLAQLLPASTYPSEIDEASEWLRSGGDAASIDEQGWDESVKAIAHYPEILDMLAEDMEWTADLGNAFVNQPEDVTEAIQRLRWRAKDMGNLAGTDRQQVVVEGDSIQIIPVEPEYMYIPQYDPSVVYVRRWAPGVSPFVTFGLGLAIGGWLTMDFDWGHHHVIYHGWNRPGWVNHARPRVHVRNVYINRSRPFINRAWRHDSTHGDPAKFLSSSFGGRGSGRFNRRTEVRGRSSAGAAGALRGVFGPRGDTRAFSERGRESRFGTKPRAAGAASSLRQGAAPIARDTGRGVTTGTRGVSKPSSGIFGGYRGASETRTQSQRGRASLRSAGGGSSSSGKGKASGGGKGGSSGKRSFR